MADDRPRDDTTDPAQLALELRGITKRWGPVTANDRVDFDLRRGEVHALLGENGAGKSTLMNVLYGMLRPDEGEIVVDGRRVDVHSPREAMRLGVGMVFQHFMLVPVMTVAENIVLGEEPRHNGVFLDRHASIERVRDLSRGYGLNVDADARVADITVGQQQRVEILRALYRQANVLVLDEPTAVLTAQETHELFKVLRRLREGGRGIVFITHKLREVLEIADRITVLRRGRKIATVPAEGATEASLANLMVGRDVLLSVEKDPARERGRPRLEVRDLRVDDDRGLPAVDGVSFDVHAGEIVALAGVDGNGQSELIDALTGLRAPRAGTIAVDGRDVTGHDARECFDAGIGHIPEDRRRRGLVLEFSLAENLALREYRAESRRGMLAPRAMARRARALLDEYDIRGGRPDAPASTLSGGNQQKVVVAREIGADPNVLVAAQPTRGLDVGAIEFVHRRLVAERDAGRAVLLVSLELEEVRSLADRILVIYEGRIAGELPPTATEEELGILMAGGGAAGAAAGTTPPEPR
ncbi:MAG TPA: ABC transporter ATP-binding protein [Solirubrobacteraceae bacterium]|nr:ABC transporter ATP-binding protein [Solirubrobacteraceae bacterium]